MLCAPHGNVPASEGIGALQNGLHMVATTVGLTPNHALAVGFSLPALEEALDPWDGEVLSRSVL